MIAEGRGGKDRGHVHDAAPAAFPHCANLRTRAVEDAVEVDREDCAPALVSELACEGAVARHAGVVDGNIETPKLLDHHRHGGVHGCRVGHVHRHGYRVPSETSNVGRHPLGTRLVDVEDGYARPRAGKLVGTRLADAARSPGDERYPAVELVRRRH